ncbi:aminomethyltransferase [Jannaschia pagri]|uniref:Aminomethyltransferase n=1 Tax=Jannaschia pagri TaxID=2829797 RepID=A0ABQ4NKF4_9RHOB|nr:MULTISPECIES: folate-binding protein [unclassified Jannaschia]GIT91064.1 aminomethyltransferase [Jannaschia sp. AI_61]GIT94896.1 aminomethyltransferase [Jannaschia sp. AI_62]
MTRTVLRISGADRATFLDGLLTANVPAHGLGYAALLTPQGKYLADFLTWQDAEATYLDVATDLAQATAQRLTMYRLRAKVDIADARLTVGRGLGEPPAGALADPRPGMGWRHYGGSGDGGVDWDAVRVDNLIPETGRELIHGESYILEMGFERLGGVDFKKGCYVGQEIVARMHHKTTLRKGLARVAGPVTEGAEITSGGKPAGVIHTCAGDRALAYLRFDRAEGMETPQGPLTRDA